MLIGSSFAMGKKDTMNTIMDSWIGENINSVIKIWGYPTNEQYTAGHKLYIWNQGTSLKENIWGTAFVNQDICTRILEVDNNEIVTNYQWKGTECPAFSFTGTKWINPKKNPW